MLDMGQHNGKSNTTLRNLAAYNIIAIFWTEVGSYFKFSFPSIYGAGDPLLAEPSGKNTTR